MSESSVGRSHTPPLIVREIEGEDAGAVAELSGQLGYEASAETIGEHIAQLPSRRERQIVFVACLGAEIAGWIEASIMHDLQSPPYSLIGGLVVRDERRSLGIGKALCAEVEAWSRKQGITVIRVTSRLSREGAHKFYLREGFQRIKTWAVFEKILP